MVVAQQSLELFNQRGIALLVELAYPVRPVLLELGGQLGRVAVFLAGEEDAACPGRRLDGDISDNLGRASGEPASDLVVAPSVAPVTRQEALAEQTGTDVADGGQIHRSLRQR